MTMGVGLVAYERLPEGGPLRLTLYGAGNAIECIGNMKSVATPDSQIVRAGGRGDGRFSYGLAFGEPTLSFKRIR